MVDFQTVRYLLAIASGRRALGYLFNGRFGVCLSRETPRDLYISLLVYAILRDKTLASYWPPQHTQCVHEDDAIGDNDAKTGKTLILSSTERMI